MKAFWFVSFLSILFLTCKPPNLCNVADTRTTCGLIYHLFLPRSLPSSALGSLSNESSVSLIPSSPNNFTVVAGNGKNTLSWSSVTGASSYNLYWSNTAGVSIASGNKISNVISPYVHLGLTNGTNFFYIVTSQNENLESIASVQVSATPVSPNLRAYVTASAYPMGSLGSVAGADARCMSDSGKPSGSSTFKALLVDETGCSGNPCRRASITSNAGDGQIDWVLQPNTNYFRFDGTTPIMTTNANGLFVFGTLTNSWTTTAVTGISGMSGTWTTFTNVNCTSYSSTGGNVTTAQYTQTGTGSISNATLTCAGSYNLLCIEQ